MRKSISILVTGCSGFLGPWLCERLLDSGARVVGVDIEFPPMSRIHSLAERMQIVDLDVMQAERLHSLICEHEIDFVFHLAAQALVGVAQRDPAGTLATNIMGTVNVLESARVLAASDRPLKGIVVASSDKAYGDHDQLPYLEPAPMLGRFPYDVSKSCADLISRSYFHSYGLPVCVTRCGNLYGGGDLNWSRIVPGTFRSYIEGSRPVIRSDGSPVRDYIYVDDAARAMIALGDKMLDDSASHGEAFNISDDKPLTVLEVVEAIEKISGRSDLPPLVEATATGEIQEQYLDSSKLRALTGWSPSVDIEEGLSLAFEWYREHLNPVLAGES